MSWPSFKPPWYQRLIGVRNLYWLFKRKPKFDKIQMPMIRQQFPKLQAEDLVGIQPMISETKSEVPFKVIHKVPTKWEKFKTWIWR